MTAAVQGCAGLCRHLDQPKFRANPHVSQGVQGVQGYAHIHVGVYLPVMACLKKILSRVESSTYPAHPAHPTQSQINQGLWPFIVRGYV